jgi:hypothetical protein
MTTVHAIIPLLLSTPDVLDMATESKTTVAVSGSDEEPVGRLTIHPAKSTK